MLPDLLLRFSGKISIVLLMIKMFANVISQAYKIEAKIVMRKNPVIATRKANINGVHLPAPVAVGPNSYF